MFNINNNNKQNTIPLQKQSFLGDSFIYIIGVVLNQGVNFLTLMILARLLSPGDYGIIAIYGLWVNICLAFISLQGAVSVNNALIEYGEDKLSSYVFSISLLSIVVSVITIVGVLVLRSTIEDVIGLSTYIVILLVIQTAISSFSLLQLEKNRVLKKARSAVFWTSSIPVLRFVLSIVLILSVFRFSYLGDIYGFFIASVIIGLIALIKTAIDAGFKFNIQHIKYCLPITVPIIFHAVPYIILTMFDRHMISIIIDEKETGIYSFIYNISIIPTGIWFAVNNPWGVEYFEKMKKNEHKAIESLTNIYIKYMFFIYVLILLLLPEVILIIATPEYFSGITYASFIMAGGFILFLHTICARHELYAKKTMYIPIATIISAIINIVLNLILIPRYGAFGAAITAFISYSILFIMHYIFAGLVIKGFPIKFWKMALPAALLIGLAVFVYVFIDYMLIRLSLALVFGIFVAFNVFRSIRRGDLVV